MSTHQPQRDDERYPSVVEPNDRSDAYPTVVEPSEHHDAPEVIAQPPLDYYGHDKMHRGEGGRKGMTDDGPEAVVGADAVGADAVGANSKRKSYCGLRRRNFFILLAIAAVIVVAAVVGGAVGGIEGSKHSKHGDSSSSSSGSGSSAGSATATGSSSAPIATGPIEASERGLAAAVVDVSQSNTATVQLFYQDLATRNVLSRVVELDAGGPQQTVKLSIKPNWGTPLAAAAVLGSNPPSLQLFYVSSPGSTTNIVQATLHCPSGTKPCTTISNSIISKNISETVLPGTKLAAIRPDSGTIRVYFQTIKTALHVLNGDDADTSGWTESKIASNASSGTAIAVAGASKASLNVFYISKGSNQPSWVQYSDLIGTQGSTSLGSSDSNSGSAWSADVSFAAAYVPTVNHLRVYYAKPDNGSIVSYFEHDDNSFGQNHDPDWATVEGGLAVASWEDQARMYYFDGGDLVVSPQYNGTWATPLTLS